MNDQPTGRNAASRLLREILRWGIAVLIVWLLVRRLIHDWPTVRPALDHLQWGWLTLGIVPGVLYFLLRIAAWRNILASAAVPVHYGRSAKVWMNSEIARYIPGNLWSVVGRLAQATQLGTSRTVVFSSMVLEALQLVMAAAGLSSMLLLGYSNYVFSGRPPFLLFIAIASCLVSHRRISQWIIGIVHRVVKRVEVPQIARNLTGAYAYMVAAWVAFALLNLFVVASLGIRFSWISGLAIAGSVVLSWLIGYASFITPSGIGVREAVLVFMLAPYLGTADAILVAVMSRVVFTVLEVATLAGVNFVVRRRS